MEVFNADKNSWLRSCQNVKFENNVLEAELKDTGGNWKYNRIYIHNLLLNKNLSNDNGIFRYNLTKDEDDEIMKQLFPIYEGETIDHIDIYKCVMLSINSPKYDKTREETLQILLNHYILPPLRVHYGYTKETASSCKFYEYMQNKNNRNEFTLGMLEIFENFANEDENENRWMLYLEDDVRVINLKEGDNLSILYNVPVDAELIRLYNGKNEPCDITNVKYKISHGGGYCHAFYIKVSACKKVIHYAKKYKWKFICDIDIFKLAKHCGNFPTGYDGWTLSATDNVNDITDKLQEDEKINMYHLTHCIFNQTSLPCV